MSMIVIINRNDKKLHANSIWPLKTNY